MKKIIITLLFAMLLISVKAQILTPVNWSYGIKKTSNTEAVIFLRAKIDNGWHIYSQTSKDGGPIKTSFYFDRSDNYILSGKTIEPKPIVKFEPVFNMPVAYFEHEVIFQQKIKLGKTTPQKITGKLKYMTCNDQKCLPPDEVNFSIPFNIE